MQLDAFRKATVKGVATRVGGADVKKLKIELARAMGERCVDALLKKGASVDSIRMSNRALASRLTSLRMTPVLTLPISF